MSRLPSSGTTGDIDSLAALDALLKLNAASKEQQFMMDHCRARANLSESLHRSMVNGLPSGYSSAASSLATLVSAQSLLSPSSSAATVALHRAVEMLSWPTNGAAGATSILGRHQLSPSRQATAQVAAGIQHHHDQLIASQTLSQQLQEAVEQGHRSAAPVFAAGNGKSVVRTPVACSSSTDTPVQQRNNQSTGTDMASPSNDPPSRATIRAEKVEAALRSKPQRGKKRDDLSEKERVELTRTRNREHAKSTRVRKKARYEELLDCERKVEEIRRSEKLKAERLMGLQQFVALREAMLHRDGPVTISTQASDVARLKTVVGQDGSFQYDAQNVTNTHSDAECDSRSANGSSQSLDNFQEAISRMSGWDQRVRERALAFHTQEQKHLEQAHESSVVLKAMKYEIVGGVDGIAISNDGHGYVRADLIFGAETSAKPSSMCLQGTIQRRTILTGMLVVRFEGNSSRIATATWTTLQDNLPITLSSGRTTSDAPIAAAGDGVDFKSDHGTSSLSKETLGCQLVHPSVVSLDHGKGTFDAEESNGPGMDI